MAARILTTPIAVPNITRVEIAEYEDRLSSVADPHFSLTLHFRAIGGRDAGTFTITARDAANSDVVVLNPSPQGLADSILGGKQEVAGAATALADAFDAAKAAASGNRKAKEAAGLAAALLVAQTMGLVGAGLAST